MWATGVGLLAVWTALWMRRQRRVRGVRVLDVAQAFALGRGDVVSADKVLYLNKGRIVRGRHRY